MNMYDEKYLSEIVCRLDLVMSDIRIFFTYSNLNMEYLYEIESHIEKVNKVLYNTLSIMADNEKYENY